MKNFQQALQGIAIALASIVLLLGGFSLSLAEGGMTKPFPTAAPTIPQPPTPTPTWGAFIPPAESYTPAPPTWTPSLPPPPTSCPPPAGWIPYQVQAGDTLDALAAHYRLTSAALGQANCLPASSGLLPGVVVYVPRGATQTPLPCGGQPGWIVYTVRPGDTLYRLAQAYGISVTALQQANCLGNSTLLHTGQTLSLPPWATRTLIGTFTSSSTPTGTLSPSPSRTPVTPATWTLANTPTFTDTETPTETATETATDTSAELPTETFTETPTSP
jgi:LysM repeat protein